MCFFDFPAGHWQSIRTASPIESALATILHRTRAARGCLSRSTMLLMTSRPGQHAESRWRRLRGFRHRPRVIEGVEFRDGIEIQPDTKTAAQVDQRALADHRAFALGLDQPERGVPPPSREVAVLISRMKMS